MGAFNVENLFARWRFGSEVDPAPSIKNGSQTDPALLVEIGL